MIEQENTLNMKPKPPRKRPGRTQFYRTPAGKKLIARYKREYSGRSQPKNLGRTGPGRHDRSPAVSNWELVKCLVRGELPEGMKKNAAETRGRCFGLAYGTVFFCDQGEPFTDGELQRLREHCGFTTSSFEQITGLSARSTDRRHIDMVRAPEIARNVIEWRDRTLCSLLQVPSPAYKCERVLKTFLPDLRRTYRLCRDHFAKIQMAMQADDGGRIWTSSSLGNFACEQAKQSAKQKRHAGQWGTFLRYLAELDACEASKRFLEAKLKSVKRSKALAIFVRELLGQRYGTTHWTVNRTLSQKVAVIPSAEMCGLILSPRSASPITQTTQKGGRPPRDIFPEADRLQREDGRTWPEIAQMLDPKTFRHNPKAAEEAIRQGVYRLRKKLKA